MNTKRAIVILFLATIASAGCAVTELTAEGSSVQTISDHQTANCKFLDSLSTYNTNSLSKDAQSDARARAKNRVAELGGDSLRILSTDQQISEAGIGSIFTINAEAYKCRE